jgi:hypothetical protein
MRVCFTVAYDAETFEEAEDHFQNLKWGLCETKDHMTDPSVKNFEIGNLLKVRLIENGQVLSYPEEYRKKKETKTC